MAQKKDSFEICFVPGDDYAGFLKNYRGVDGTEGDFVDTEGNVLGQHAGFEKFTVGQRKGLGIAFGEPRFVIRINPETKQVVLGQREDLAANRIHINGLNWLTDAPTDSLECSVKVRYQQASKACSVDFTSEDTAIITPQEPIIGVAPGQAAVFYDGDKVLGGGWIQSSANVGAGSAAIKSM